LDNFVKVTTNDSKIHRARAVISTVPMGVLQRSIEFIPNLPNEKWEAIDSFGIGGVNKCIMYWDSNEKDISWWPKGKYEMQLMTNDNATSDVWTYFLNDQVYSVHQDYHVLTAWNAGDIVEILEVEDDETTMNRILINLRKMFGNKVPEPTKILVTH